MKTKTLILMLLSGAFLGLTGCATPQSRIKKNPELYQALPPEVRANVQEGNVQIGYTQDAVYLALGQPDRKYSRTTFDGNTQIWSWVDYDYHTDRQRVSARFNVRDSEGRVHRVSDSVWVDVKQAREYETKRVEIADGVVKAIEDITR